MINRTMIRHMAGSAAFSKGEDLYLSNKIYNFSVEVDEEDDPVDCIEAQVKGSGRNRYDVMLKYDYETGSLEESYCDCPAFYSYSGICKHCVAVALKYLDYQKSHQKERQETAAGDSVPEELRRLMQALGIPTDDEDSEESQRDVFSDGFGQDKARTNTRGRGGKASRAAQAMQTTPSIQRLLTNQVSQRMSRLQSSVHEEVSLDPYLTYSYGEMHLEFKLGIKQKYVLKDVFALTRRIRNQEEYAYGQKLKFLHTIDAFTPESQKLVKFLMDWTEKNRQRFLQTTYYGYSYSSTPQELRHMPLSPSDLEDFLEAVEDREFTAQIGNTPEQMWHVTGEPVPRTMEICGKKDGIEVSVNYLSGIAGNRYYIYFQEPLIHLIPR